MVKKVLCALLAILAVVSLSAGLGYGLAWYESNHVTVGGHSYYIYEEALDLTDRNLSIAEYEQLQTVLPECDITWMVPFQGGRFSSASASLKVTSFTQADMDLVIRYFPSLTALDASGCKDYAVLRSFQAAKQNCAVSYQVDLGGGFAELDAASLTLENGDYHYETLTENLQYLPKLETLTLKTPDLTLEQIDSLKLQYPDLTIHCTVEVLGQEFDNETTELDLSGMEAADVEAMAQKLAMLPKLEFVELMASDATAKLSPTDVKTLVNLCPEVSFHYEFDFYGQKLSSEMEEVVLTKVKIGDAGEEALRTALDLMPKCKRFVLDNCGFSDAVLAKVREDYRDRTKIVWRISFARVGSCLTDVEIFVSCGNLEKNYSSVQYCEDVVYMDIGHCENLKTIEFVEKMPKLKALIVSGSEVKDLSPLKNCKELEFLELGFCGYVDDLSPLKNLTNLRMLNISDTKVTDLSPLDNLNLTNFVALRSTGKSRVSAADQQKFITKHPDCWTKFDGKQPYGIAWRYAEDNSTFLPYYHMLRKLFRYDLAPNNPKQVGLYLSDVDSYLKDKLKESTTLADYQKAVEDELAQWQKEASASAADTTADTAADTAAANTGETGPAETTAETVPESASAA